MRRKTAVAGFSYLAGMFFASFFHSSTIFLYVAVIFILNALVLLVNVKQKTVIVTVLVSVAVGMAVYGGYQFLEYEKVTAFDGKSGKFDGEIIDYKYVSNDIMLITANGEIDNVETKITAFIPYENCNYYDDITFVGKFEKIENNIAFNSLDYNKAEGIYLNAFNCENVEITDGGFSLFKIIRNYSDDVYLKILKTLPDEQGAFLGAMLCGSKSNYDSFDKTNLYNIGIGHIFSVSGTHLVVITIIFGYLFDIIKLSKRHKIIANETVILIFAIFAGMSSSVLRAALMMTVFNLSNIFRRIPDSITTIAVCGIALTIFSPQTIRSASFLLSMSGAFSLSVVTPQVSSFFKIRGKFKKVLNSFIGCVCVWFVTLPFVMLYFNKVSVISAFVNLIFVPVCTAALVLTVIATLFSFAGFVITPFLYLAGVLVKIVIVFAEFVGKQWFVTISFGNLPLRISILASVVIVLVFLLIKRNIGTVIKATLLCFTCTCLIYSASLILNKEKVEIYMINYQNSCSIVLNKNQKAVIIDNSGENSDVVLRLLEYKGIIDVTGVFTFDNIYFAQAVYNSKLDFCDFDYKKCYNINEVLKFNFSGAEIKFDEDFLVINYNDEIIKIPYEFESDNENGEIFVVTTDGVKTCEKRRFSYAFL